MKDKKRELFLFSAWDRTGLEDHLSRMAEKGWLVEKLTSFSLIYRRTDPKKLTFCICYYPKASAFAPGPSEDQQTFYEFCQYAGWVLAAEYAQLQIFYNEREDPVPIETDPLLELETIHKTMKRSGLPAQILLAVLALFQGGLLISSFRRDPIGLLSSSSSLFTGLCWVLVLVMTAAEVIAYCRWRSRARKAAERGEFLPSSSRVRLQAACLVIVGAGLLYYALSVFTSGDRMMITIMPLMFLWMGLLFFLVNAIRNGLKRKKVSANVNRVVTIVSAFVLAYAMVGAIIFGVLYGGSRGWFAGEQGTYQYHGSVFTIYDDELPLTVEGLTGAAYSEDAYTREWRDAASLLLAQYTARQHPRFDAENYRELPVLEYTVTQVKIPALYNMCKNALLAEYDGSDEIWQDRVYAPIDPIPWGAAEAYRVMDEEYGPWDRYLLCYPDRFVEFRPDWELTPEQMALVGEKLGTN